MADMSSLMKRIMKKKKESPLDRLMKGTMTEEEKENYLVGYKKDKEKKKRKKELGY